MPLQLPLQGPQNLSKLAGPLAVWTLPGKISTGGASAARALISFSRKSWFTEGSAAHPELPEAGRICKSWNMRPKSLA